MGVEFWDLAKLFGPQVFFAGLVYMLLSNRLTAATRQLKTILDLGLQAIRKDVREIKATQHDCKDSQTACQATRCQVENDLHARIAETSGEVSFLRGQRNGEKHQKG